MTPKEDRIFIGRFEHECDLLKALYDFAKKNSVELGVFQVIGALKKAQLGYYNQDAKKYIDCVSLNKKLEIASCSGNISLKDFDVFVHAHVVLADHEGKCYGGHLMPGSKIFAAEYCIKELRGLTLNRVHDPITGLSLWGWLSGE